MWVGSSSSAATVAFGLPVRNGSTRIVASPSVSSTADWPRKRISISSLLRSIEFVRQLVPDGDADQHRDARLLRQQGTDRAHAIVALRLAGGLEQRRLVRRAEPVRGRERLV